MEIKEEALKGTSCKLLMPGGHQAGLAGAADKFSSSACGQPAEKVLESVRSGAASIPAGWTGRFPCFIPPGTGVPSSAGELSAIVAALAAGRLDGRGVL